MKKICVLLLATLLLLTSCSMEEVIPGAEGSFENFNENKEIYERAVDAVMAVPYDCLISRNDYYTVDGSENFVGLFVQNVESGKVEEIENENLDLIFQSTDVKLIDKVVIEDLVICAFDMCIPGRNFDYGIYFVSKDAPVFIGDPSKELLEKDGGFVYEEPASYGVKFSFFTQKLADHYYYYEIN